MGAWGTGNWENDGALDFLADIVERANIAGVARTFENVLQKAVEEPIDGSLACKALAAGELVAAYLGCPGKGLPEEAVEWLSSQEKNIDPRLQRQAMEAVRRVREQSELKNLWQEAGEEEDWLGVVDNLITRLDSNRAATATASDG